VNAILDKRSKFLSNGVIAFLIVLVIMHVVALIYTRGQIHSNLVLHIFRILFLPIIIFQFIKRNKVGWILVFAFLFLNSFDRFLEIAGTLISALSSYYYFQTHPNALSENEVVRYFSLSDIIRSCAMIIWILPTIAVYLLGTMSHFKISKGIKWKTIFVMIVYYFLKVFLGYF